MAPPALPADEVVPEIQAEMRRILLLGRPTYSIGLFSAAAILGTVLWPHVDHRHLLVWLALALGCAALFTVAVYGPLARRTRADGVPVLMDPANVASGIVFGAVTWVDPHALAHSDPVPWICVAGLFALSAGSTIGRVTVHKVRRGEEPSPWAASSIETSTALKAAMVGSRT